MTYKFVNNLLSSQNHWTLLKDLFEKSDEILIVSPFLMTDITDFLDDIELATLKKIHLITTLAPKSFDQIRKISSLISLIEFSAIKDNKIRCQISINNKLHGKVYIFKKQGNYISAIISSANFTDSGLSRNHEWGIEIFNKEEIIKLEASILDSIEFPDLKFDDIYVMQQATNDFLEKQPKAEIREIELSLTDLIKTKNLTEVDPNINYWLKPIGVADNPISEGLQFNKPEEDLHFSKQRPNGVMPNDILITYAVGTTKILSVYRSISYPKHVTQEQIDDEGDEWIQRWPWYIVAENLTPYYGSTWSQNNLFRNSLREEFLRQNPGEPITSVGSQTLGALNYGKDKLKLAPKFAIFILNKIFEINSGKVT